MGWPPPIEANATFLLLPSGNVLVMVLTAEGRQKDIAMPPKARKTINWVPVLDNPHAKVNIDCNIQPVRYMGLEPTTSDTEPSSNNVQPHVSA
jgi:hypothetical protein